MAAPVIDPSQSIPDFNQWQSWFFQPRADNDPTSWTVAGLPPGMSLDTATGKISGAATLPGIGAFDLTAINADGSSSPVRFRYGIRPAPQPIPAGAIATLVDLSTSAITFTGPDPAVGPMRKRGDDLYLWIQFMRGGLGVDVPVHSACLAFKGDPAQPPILLQAGFQKFGTGENAVYLTWVNLAVSDAQLVNISEDAAEPAEDAQIANPASALLALSTFADLQGELRITFNRDSSWTIGPSIPTFTTFTFPFRLVRDLET